jgi:hypothetical protein
VASRPKLAAATADPAPELRGASWRADEALPGPVGTRAVFRVLMMRGLAADEAANLTAFMCGIPVGERHWSIAEVNRLLFLRELERRGRFGAGDGGTEPTH